MFERFSDDVRRVMVLCQDEARKLSHNVIAPHHIALGLLRLEEERRDGPLTLSGVDLASLRQSIEAEAGRGMPTGLPGVSPPFTPESKKVMEESLREALQLGHNWIGPEHQLLALIKGGIPSALAEMIPMEPALEMVREHFRRTESQRPLRSRTRPRLRGFVEVMRSAISGSAPGTPAGSQHILLALVARQDTLAGQILAELGVTKAKVQELIETMDTKGTLDEAPDAQVEVRVGGRTVTVSKIALSDTISILRKKDPQGAADLAMLLERDDPEPDADA